MIGERELSPIYQGKGTLFANFPTKAVTGCFVFRPMVTNMAFLLLVQVKRFLAVANKTHLSIIRECFIFSKELWPKCAPVPGAAAPGRAGVAPRGWSITKLPCQGEGIDSAAPKLTKRSAEATAIHLKQKKDKRVSAASRNNQENFSAE